MMLKQGLRKEKMRDGAGVLQCTLPTDILTALAIHKSYGDDKRRGVYLVDVLYGTQLVAM